MYKYNTCCFIREGSCRQLIDPALVFVAIVHSLFNFTPYRGKSELQSLYASRMSEKRETLFEDRTRCHADHVGQGLGQQTTAAVGILKAVKFAEERCVCVCCIHTGSSHLMNSITL